MSVLLTSTPSVENSIEIEIQILSMMEIVIHSTIDLFTSVGLKRTKGRAIVLKELERRKDHFNAEKLYSSLVQKGEGVSRPTIYRTLKILEKLCLIERFDIKKSCFYFEPLSWKKDHGHLICERCGKIIDFSSNGIEILKSEACKEKDFKLDKISIQIFGLCGDCQKASKKPITKH
ncbi:MAG: transcriptional repressor [Syntrophaceae bacterium]|nr:transcriptional repressor [Syntrophaceae bacterium]